MFLRHECDGLPLRRAPARERDGDLAVWAHHVHRRVRLVLLRRANYYGAYPGAGRQHFVRRLPTAGFLTDARSVSFPASSANRGDKLVFSNGIVILAIFSSILVAAFGGDTTRLIPLYAVGVFLSFTLSQTGMVRHWLKERDRKRLGGRLRQVTPRKRRVACR